MSFLQLDIDEKNSEYWNELCGSSAAKYLGITDSSRESIEKFDNWYFSFYPYLQENYLQLEKILNKKVLEIGLGYGTVSQWLAKSAHSFTGIDIAEGPVNFLNHRLKLMKKPYNACVMSAHQLNFPDNCFDFVVSIGCFHHTGNIKKCIDEAYRVLVPGGILLFMCYNKHSFREFCHHPIKTFFSFYEEFLIFDNSDRFRYDKNLNGKEAPFTEASSKRGLVNLCEKFSFCKINVENIGGSYRRFFIKNLGRIFGTDLYVQCIK